MNAEVLSTIIASVTTIGCVWFTNRRDVNAQTRKIEEITERQTEQIKDHAEGKRQ